MFRDMILIVLFLVRGVCGILGEWMKFRGAGTGM